MTLDQAQAIYNHHATRLELPSEWRLAWIKRIRNYSMRGSCNHTKKLIRLQPCYVERASEEMLTNTILHELAHAIVGVGHGHDHTWKRKAIEIGCNGKRLGDETY
ncbi:MAG: SprT-like domain-containing protein [Fluviibacter sp.]